MHQVPAKLRICRCP